MPKVGEMTAADLLAGMTPAERSAFRYSRLIAYGAGEQHLDIGLEACELRDPLSQI